MEPGLECSRQLCLNRVGECSGMWREEVLGGMPHVDCKDGHWRQVALHMKEVTFQEY